jgi:nitrogen fixation protein FixH
MTAKPLRGIHVFWMILAFFVVVIGVDTFFIVRAVATFPGEQVKNSYILGLDYNREIESRARQAQLGWTAEAGIRSEDKPALVVRLADEAKAPIAGLDVSAVYHVIGGERGEHALALIEQRPGEYQAPVQISSSSRIELSITVRRQGDGEAIFRAGKTLVAP